MPSHPYNAKREAFIQAKVEKALARWEGSVTPEVLATMREIAENFYRTDPVAIRGITILMGATREISGRECLQPEDETGSPTRGTKKG